VASVTKTGKRYRAWVARRGVRKSATFATKAEASAWATQVEAEILSGTLRKIPAKTFADLLDRYAQNVSPKHEGCRWEQIRLALLSRDNIGKVPLPEFAASHVADWRDRRLKIVSASSVRREWGLMSAACTVAIKEWNWLASNPFKEINRPKKPEHRTRRISNAEIERLCLALGYDRRAAPDTAMSRVGAALLFAIETAMRAGEIAALQPEQVNLAARTAHLPRTKNGSARDVPLSSEAVRILRQLERVRVHGEPVFRLSSQQIDALFRKGKKRALVEGLRFHDTRREGTSRLAKKVDVLRLAKITGHKNLKELLTYYEESADEMAKRLG
jgi:integrase